MCTRLELMEAAADRRLAALTEYINRAHVVWLELDGTAVDATRGDWCQVQNLLLDGLLQSGDHTEHVTHNGADVAVVRILPTTAGNALLVRLRDQAALATAAAAIGGAA